MGLFKAFLTLAFGVGPLNKESFAKNFCKQRMRQVAAQVGQEFDERIVDSLTSFEVAGLPEFSIATLVEQYASVKHRGVSDEAIFEMIEAHRESTLGAGKMPPSPTLEAYVLYRIKHEAPESAAGLTDEHIVRAVKTLRPHFQI